MYLLQDKPFTPDFVLIRSRKNWLINASLCKLGYYPTLQIGFEYVVLFTFCYSMETQSDYLITENAINGFQSGRVHLCLEFLYNVPPTLISPLRLWSFREVNGTELLQESGGGDGIQPPAESPQAPQEQHLLHLLLKMFDSRQLPPQMTVFPPARLCFPSCCVNMPSLHNCWTMQAFEGNKGTSVCLTCKQMHLKAHLQTLEHLH